MSLLNTVTSLLLLTVVSCTIPDTIRITDPFKITPYTQEKSSLELFPGRRNCGGKGIVKEVRYEKCIIGEEGICMLSYENLGRGEMVFVPSASSKGLGFIFRIFATGAGGGEPKTIILEHKFPDLSVEAGREYIFTVAGGPTMELKGKHLTAQWEISRLEDKQVEICSEGDMYVF